MLLPVYHLVAAICLLVLRLCRGGATTACTRLLLVGEVFHCSLKPFYE